MLKIILSCPAFTGETVAATLCVLIRKIGAWFAQDKARLSDVPIARQR